MSYTTRNSLEYVRSSTNGVNFLSPGPSHAFTFGSDRFVFFLFLPTNESTHFPLSCLRLYLLCRLSSFGGCVPPRRFSITPASYNDTKTAPTSSVFPVNVRATVRHVYTIDILYILINTEGIVSRINGRSRS